MTPGIAVQAEIDASLPHQPGARIERRRGAPDHGEIDYGYVFRAIAAMGWDAPPGAEYKPDGATDDTVAWLRRSGAAGSGASP